MVMVEVADVKVVLDAAGGAALVVVGDDVDRLTVRRVGATHAVAGDDQNTAAEAARIAAEADRARNRR